MNPRHISMAIVMALTATAPASAQSGSAAAQCTGREPVAWLGISGIDCNCTVGSSNPDNWSFRTEPRITSLEVGTRGGNILKIGDVITHVNGHLITTREGARAYATVKPGQAVILTVRRNGEQLKFAITAESTCTVPHIYTPSRAHGVAPTPAARASAYAMRPSARTTASASSTQRGPRGSFGFGLMCSGNCSITVGKDGALHFSEPPEVYSVERGSGAAKADLRRGDVITHVNGVKITSRYAGEMFGRAKPGETVKFTVRRGGMSRVVSLTAAATPTRYVEFARSGESLDRAQESLRELQREQSRHMEQLVKDLRGKGSLEHEELRDMHRELYRQQQEQRRKLSELSQELERAESSMRTALRESARAGALAPTAPQPGSSRTLRYTGVVGGSEVEVRGPHPVNVRETATEVVITTGSTEVRVKKAKR